ncbi:transposon Tf2-6 polyprotein, partial [Trichonephila clavata]
MRKIPIKDLFMNIIEERVENSKAAEQATERERRRVEMDFELQKLKLQLETQKSGVSHEVEVYTNSVVIRLEGRVIRTPLIALPYAKGNRTLLGMDFLQKAGIVQNLRHRNWFFCDTPCRTYDFVKEVLIQEVQSLLNLEENTCLLREDE